MLWTPVSCALPPAGVKTTKAELNSDHGRITHWFKNLGAVTGSAAGLDHEELQILCRYVSSDAAKSGARAARLVWAPINQVSGPFGICRHEKGVTMQSYAKVLPAAVHIMAGWGRDWRQGHWLGQAQVLPPSSLLEQILPGLHQMQSQVQSRATADQQLRKYSESVDMLYFLGTVFLQTLPLCLAQHGDSWCQVLTAGMQAVLLMPDWANFQKEVMHQYAWGQQGLHDRDLHTICPGVATARAMTSALYSVLSAAAIQ